MAADQLPPCADDVFKNGVSACLVGDVPKHAAETICQSLSAITGWKIDWHYIGGRTHIKALAPVAQPNPEPIAWMVGTAIWWTKEEAERDAAATGLSIVGLGPMTGAAPAEQHQGIPVGEVVAFGKGLHEIAWAAGRMPKLGAKLYTHADAGEVGRLRDQLLELAKTIHKRHYAKSAPDFEPFDFSSGLIGQIDNMVAGMLQDLSTLRAQLAERDALLRDINKRHASGVDFDLPADLAARVTALSASAEPIPFPGYPPVPEDRKLPAEPSAPVERDERAAFEADQLSKGFAVDLLPGTVATYMIPAVRFSWAGWQARAALERKP